MVKLKLAIVGMTHTRGVKMNEEKYQNGDIYWNKYDGTFKAFDKDGNEIKFPTEDTGYQVKLDVQGILNLYEKNKELKRIEELRIAQIENLKQENKELHSVLEEIHLILDELKQQYDYMADYSEIKERQDKINGVLE